MTDMDTLDARLKAIILSAGTDNRLPTERTLADKLQVSRARLRKHLARLEADGAIVRKRRTGTVAAGAAASILKTAIYVGRKPLADFAREPARRARNLLNWRIEDEIAEQACDYRLVTQPYVADPIRLRKDGRPTLFGCGATSLPALAAYGLCEDLTERARAWEAFGGIWPNLWESVSLDGRIHALPSQARLFLLFGNRARMQECGADPDRPPQTWDELTEAAIRMTDAAAGRFGLALPEDNHLAWSFTDLLFQAGGTPIRSAGAAWTPAFQEPPGVRALTYLKDLRWKHRVLLPRAGGSGDVARAFFEGRAGLCIMECADMFTRLLREGWCERETGVWPLPAGPDGHALCHVSVYAAFVNAYASAEEKQAAWRHVAALNGRQAQNRRGRALGEAGEVAGWPSIFRDMTPAETEVGLPPAWFRTAQGCLARGLPEPRGAGWNMDVYLSPALRHILDNPAADPAEELRRAAATVQPLLAFH